MKRFIFYSLLVPFLPQEMVAQEIQDTTLVKRPQYFGVFVGGLMSLGPSKYIYESSPSPVIGLNQVTKLEIRNAIQAGIFFTYPFLRRMEWDAGVGVFNFNRERTLTEVTELSNDTPRAIASMHSWREDEIIIIWELKTHFSVLLVQHDNFSILAGAGGWLTAHRPEPWLNPGILGVEGNITAYCKLRRKSFLQLHVSPGVMKNGFYINATLGFCYQNQKTMRVRPKNYYVRTYDD